MKIYLLFAVVNDAAVSLHVGNLSLLGVWLFVLLVDRLHLVK